MTKNAESLPRYTAGQFAAPQKACDLIMKGGVTSGVVYPYAILQLAQDYRLRAIGGTSAGAIAAAFAAAAEYGRQAGDPAAFVRFETRCLQIPQVLAGLFQPSPPLRPLMTAVQAWSSTKRWTRWAKAAAPFWPSILIGAVAGAVLMILLGKLLGAPWLPPAAAVPGVVLAAALGGLIGLGLRIASLVFRTLPAHGFGLCSGMAPPGSPPVLTDWIHRSLQYIAFGDEAAATPLTFGHLARVGLDAAALARGEKAIDLRMITTNLSMRRPHALPDLGGRFLFRDSDWSRLFPAAIGAYLAGASPHAKRAVAPPDAEHENYRKAPEPEDWPVTVAVRMSLSFPVLIETVPMATRDLSPVADDVPLSEDAPTPPLGLKRVLFSDGGLSSNFPIHFFDALLPSRPTFALSLDELAETDDPARRVSMPQTAKSGSFSTILPVEGLGGFAGAVLGAAKDWRDQMLSVMPGQRERIVRVKLASNEGGLNLAMPPETSQALMSYGDEAGALIRTTFNFDEHRWRRTLVAYEQLQSTLQDLERVWPAYGAWFASYAPNAQSYPRVTATDRAAIRARFGHVAAVAAHLRPPVRGKDKFPRPAGRLRIVPDV